VTCAFLHGGTSSVATIGAPPGSAGFRVALPDGLVTEIRDASLSVSRADAQVAELGASHVLDPAAGVRSKEPPR
jgi:hypothetical protein